MDGPEARHYPGGQPYSGTNRIPNIKQFVESLDRDKKERDAKVEADLRQNGQNGELQAHVPTEKPGKNRRTVKDPITGKDVEIEDIDSKQMKTAKDPMVCLSIFTYST
jgi:hypothetical protein